MGMYHSEDPVYPAVADVVRYEAHEEGRERYTESHHDGPHAHVLGALFLEECLDDDGAADCCCGSDEEGAERSTDSHGGIRLHLGASNVE